MAAKRTDIDSVPAPRDRDGLHLRLLRQREALGAAKRQSKGFLAVATARGAVLLARLNTLLPLRVLQQYSRHHGPVMSAGVGFTMFFSITGLLTTGFSMAGLVLNGNPVLLNSVIANVAKSTPGLLRVNGSDGLVDPHALLNPTGLGWAAIIGAVVTLVTSLRWIQSLRDGVRGVLELDQLQRNPIFSKVKDLGVLVLLGISLLLTSAVTVVTSAALGLVVSVLNLDRRIAQPVGFVLGFLVAVLLSWLTAIILFRLAAALELPRRVLLESTLIAGIGTAVLQLLSGFLLARAGANPLLSSFAVIIGLLIWFNLVSQVYLLSGSWAAVRAADMEAATTARGQLLLGARRPKVTRP